MNITRLTHNHTNHLIRHTLNNITLNSNLTRLQLSRTTLRSQSIRIRQGRKTLIHTTHQRLIHTRNLRTPNNTLTPHRLNARTQRIPNLHHTSNKLNHLRHITPQQGNQTTVRHSPSPLLQVNQVKQDRQGIITRSLSPNRQQTNRLNRNLRNVIRHITNRSHPNTHQINTNPHLLSINSNNRPSLRTLLNLLRLTQRHHLLNFNHLRIHLHNRHVRVNLNSTNRRHIRHSLMININLQNLNPHANRSHMILIIMSQLLRQRQMLTATHISITNSQPRSRQSIKLQRKLRTLNITINVNRQNHTTRIQRRINTHLQRPFTLNRALYLYNLRLQITQTNTFVSHRRINHTNQTSHRRRNRNRGKRLQNNTRQAPHNIVLRSRQYNQ